MKHVLAIDQGTTSSRALIFDHEGTIVATSQREFPQLYPRAGWVEHDPEAIWESQSTVALDVVKKADLRADDIAGIGVTNQRETTVLWDRKTGEPVANAIVWQDRRTADICERLKTDGLEQTIRQRTGLMIDPYFSGTKLHWLLRNVPDAMERATRGELAFGTVDSWLVYKLTGGELHITDISNASRTLLYNIHSGQWDDELLELLDIPRAVLPDVRPSSAVCGAVQGLGDLDGVPIAGILGDQQAATLGQVCHEPGSSKNTYGTGCFLLMNTDGEALHAEHGLVTTVAWSIDDAVTYALEGSVFIGGAIVQWLRDGLGIIEQSSDVQALAKSVDDSDGVVLVPALSGLGAPHWDPYARGLLIGLTRGTTSGHIARAAVEGIAFQVADQVRAMEADSGRSIPELRADGGAAVDDLLLQFQADILQKPVLRPEVLETTALGAAYAAGLATGFWKSMEEIAEHWAVEATFEPEMSPDEAEARRSRWRDAVQRAHGWARGETSG